MDSDEPLGPNWSPWNLHPDYRSGSTYYHQCRTRGPNSGKLKRKRQPIPGNIEILKTVTFSGTPVEVIFTMRVAHSKRDSSSIVGIYPIVACPFCREVFAR